MPSLWYWVSPFWIWSITSFIHMFHVCQKCFVAFFHKVLAHLLLDLCLVFIDLLLFCRKGISYHEMIYRIIIGLCISILYPATLLNFLIVCSFFWEFYRYNFIDYMQFQFVSYFTTIMPLILLHGQDPNIFEYIFSVCFRR